MTQHRNVVGLRQRLRLALAGAGRRERVAERVAGHGTLTEQSYWGNPARRRPLPVQPVNARPSLASLAGMARGRVAGILLAGGEGSRLGQPKALVEIGGGARAPPAGAPPPARRAGPTPGGTPRAG